MLVKTITKAKSLEEARSRLTKSALDDLDNDQLTQVIEELFGCRIPQIKVNDKNRKKAIECILADDVDPVAPALIPGVYY